MSGRVALFFHHRDRRRSSEDASRAADALVRRALALGARVVAWQVPDVAFDFAPEAVDDAIELVTEQDDSGARKAAVPQGFSVGMADGELEALVELGANAALARGAALERASALAHIARAGEILLDPTLCAVRDERLLTIGSRLGALGKRRVRGLRLDTRRPFRSDVSISVRAVSAPERVGPQPFLPVELGAIGVVVGPRGAGGSRTLADLAPGAALWLVPVLGEPLGALRVAFERAGALLGSLDGEHAASIESLLAGEGLDVEATVQALASWLASTAEPVLVVDDIEHVDADSLDVLAGLLARKSCALVVRITRELPGPLAELEIAASLELSPLAADLAGELARHAVGDRIGERAASHWARRGSGLPLSIREAISEALESGDLVDADGALAPRTRLAGRSRKHGAEHWITRRLRFVTGPARRVLELCAILGGGAERALVTSFFERFEPELSGAALEAALEELAARHWLERQGERVSLPARTYVTAIDGALEDAERARMHRALALCLAESARPMAAVAAAAHALLAGDLDGALPLARRGAAACQAAGLGLTSEALTRFTESGDAATLFERGLLAGASTERVGLQRSDVPPALASRPRPPPSEAAEPLSEELLEPVHSTLIGPISAEPELAARLGDALEVRDYAAVERLLVELRKDEAQPRLADRVEAIACVARGQVGEALRLSRAVKRSAAELGASERSRASLVHAIALAAAGRASEALLEALDGLARAREATDLRGERACARFLARLSTIAGSTAAADAWAGLARAEVLSG